MRYHRGSTFTYGTKIYLINLTNFSYTSKMTFLRKNNVLPRKSLISNYQLKFELFLEIIKQMNNLQPVYGIIIIRG